MVQNHGFGGSTDRDLVQYADRLLHPFAPAIAAFQTGSNDYVGLTGTDEEMAAAALIAGKKKISRPSTRRCRAAGSSS
ncbi:hypothetical protein GCM10022221_49100 [Actinocorallia aurea]